MRVANKFFFVFIFFGLGFSVGYFLHLKKFNFYDEFSDIKLVEKASLLALRDLYESSFSNNIALFHVAFENYNSPTELNNILLTRLDDDKNKVVEKIDQLINLQNTKKANIYYYIDHSEDNPHTGICAVRNGVILKKLILKLE